MPVLQEDLVHQFIAYNFALDCLLIQVNTTDSRADN